MKHNYFSLTERIQQTRHLLTKRILGIMNSKKTNLAIAADVTSSEELLHLADVTGPHICIFKTHIDILSDYTESVPKKLRALADQHNFIIFEDRKFADIGNTVLQQYQGGIYRISDWSHLTNAHSIAGAGIIEGLEKVGGSKGNGLLLLAQMSSKGNLIDENYTRNTVDLALRYPNFVVGFICQKKLTDHPSLLHLTPGIQLLNTNDVLGQQYTTPQQAIIENHTDIIIVGRGITHHPQPAQAAAEYRQIGRESYEALYQMKILK